MKRRGFLQALGALGVTAVVAKPTLFEGTPISEIKELKGPGPRERIPVTDMSDADCVIMHKGKTIATAIEVRGPSMSREVIDITSLDSSPYYREFILARPPASIVVVTIDEYDLNKLNEAFVDDMTPVVIIIDSVNSTIEAEAWLTEMQIEPIEGGELTLKIQGGVTVT